MFGTNCDKKEIFSIINPSDWNEDGLNQ